MKKLLTILIFLIFACQQDFVEVPFRIEFKVTSLEIAMISGDKDNIGLLAGEVTELIKQVSVTTEIEKNAKGDALRLLGLIEEAKYNKKDFEELVLLKEDLMILLSSKLYQDNHLDALWHFGNALLFATNTARDPVLDLYQWNEFEQQVQEMKDIWSVLEREPPSKALLRYDEKRASEQGMLFDDLKNATADFFVSVDDGVSSTYDLCSNADALRDKYNNYLKMLANINYTTNDENNLE